MGVVGKKRQLNHSGQHTYDANVNVNANANANARKNTCEPGQLKCKRKGIENFHSLRFHLHWRLHLRCASSHVFFPCVCACISICACRCVACVNRAQPKASTNASKRSVTCPPSWKKSLTAPAYLTVLPFAFLRAEKRALASHDWVWFYF